MALSHTDPAKSVEIGSRGKYLASDASSVERTRERGQRIPHDSRRFSVSHGSGGQFRAGFLVAVD
jgi:hypothetical protein